MAAAGSAKCDWLQRDEDFLVKRFAPAALIDIPLQPPPTFQKHFDPLGLHARFMRPKLQILIFHLKKGGGAHSPTEGALRRKVLIFTHFRQHRIPLTLQNGSFARRACQVRVSAQVFRRRIAARDETAEIETLYRT